MVQSHVKDLSNFAQVSATTISWSASSLAEMLGLVPASGSAYKIQSDLIPTKSAKSIRVQVVVETTGEDEPQQVC